MTTVDGGALNAQGRTSEQIGTTAAIRAPLLDPPLLFSTVLGAWGRHVAEFMPTLAGGSFVRTIRERDTLGPWTGLAVLVAWSVAATIVAAVELRRRDA